MNPPVSNSDELSVLEPQRKLGDSNPRYPNRYGSLANCWFQPLTQTSLPGLPKQLITELRVQRYGKKFNPPNFLQYFFESTSKEVEEKEYGGVCGWHAFGITEKASGAVAHGSRGVHLSQIGVVAIAHIA